MEWLWTWGGVSFGYRDGDALWTHDGRHVGRLAGNEVFSADGRYLGEIHNGRLITHSGKRSGRQAGFMPFANRVGDVNWVDYVGYVMLVGYEDFPRPESL
jgi:sporulation protein YlmC with PRC-barrel domain